MFKQFIANFDITGIHAVGVASNPIELAMSFVNSGADSLIITDVSESDDAHEAAIGVIADMIKLLPIPVIAGGNVRRAEDVKKYLYAGARHVIIDFTKGFALTLLEDVAKRFGKEKLIVAIQDKPTLLESRFEIAEYVDSIITYDHTTLKECLDLSPVPILHYLSNVTLQQMIDCLQKDKIRGISGSFIHKNIADLHAIKSICEESGIKIRRYSSDIEWEKLKKDEFGLIPAIVTDFASGEVLMLAYMNEEAFYATLKTGRMNYYSRSRQTQWEKGETSGHYQYVKELKTDCDMDTILALVAQIGPACHTGSRSCFFNTLMKTDYEVKNPQRILDDVFAIIKDRHLHPKEGSYTNYLFDKGIDKILKKLGEEAVEIVIAAKNPDKTEIQYEISDFLYHMMVLMEEKGICWEDVTAELARR